MAFVVVAIHTHPFENCSNSNFMRGYETAVELAVPFFFLASGYLLAIKIDYPYCENGSDMSRIKRRTIKILQMYLLWTLIYLPLAAYHLCCSGRSLIKAVLVYVQGFAFIGQQYNSWPLWYLLSTIYALLIIGFVLKVKKSARVLMAISFIGSIFLVGFTTIANYEGNSIYIITLLKRVLNLTLINGRLFSGVVYIPIGMLLSHRRFPNILNWLGLIVSFALNYFVDNSIISAYLLMISAIALFEIVERIELKDNIIYSKVRKMSTTIYFVHMYVWTFYYKIVYGEKTYGADSFVFTAIITAIVAMIGVIIDESVAVTACKNVPASSPYHKTSA